MRARRGERGGEREVRHVAALLPPAHTGCYIPGRARGRCRLPGLLHTSCYIRAVAYGMLHTGCYTRALTYGLFHTRPCSKAMPPPGAVTHGLLHTGCFIPGRAERRCPLLGLLRTGCYIRAVTYQAVLEGDAPSLAEGGGVVAHINDAAELQHGVQRLHPAAARRRVVAHQRQVVRGDVRVRVHKEPAPLADGGVPQQDGVCHLDAGQGRGRDAPARAPRQQG
eukprot:5705937-Pyramimonas_sp.AAC.1